MADPGGVFAPLGSAGTVAVMAGDRGARGDALILKRRSGEYPRQRRGRWYFLLRSERSRSAPPLNRRDCRDHRDRQKCREPPHDVASLGCKCRSSLGGSRSSTHPTLTFSDSGNLYRIHRIIPGSSCGVKNSVVRRRDGKVCVLGRIRSRSVGGRRLATARFFAYHQRKENRVVKGASTNDFQGSPRRGEPKYFLLLSHYRAICFSNPRLLPC